MVNFMVGAFYHIFKMEGKKKRQGSKHLHIHNRNVSMMGSENEGMGGGRSVEPRPGLYR